MVQGLEYTELYPVPPVCLYGMVLRHRGLVFYIAYLVSWSQARYNSKFPSQLISVNTIQYKLNIYIYIYLQKLCFL
jgi:hypothetical protein